MKRAERIRTAVVEYPQTGGKPMAETDPRSPRQWGI